LGSVASESIEAAIPLQKRRSLTLAEAREKARIGRELAKAGINPSAEWRQEEEEVPTFKDAAEQYHAQVSTAWRNGKHGDQWLNTLKAYAFPVIGALTVDRIDASDVQRVLMPIWLIKGETARRVRQRIGVVLDYAHGKGWRSAEAPMRALNQLMGGIKQAKGANFAAMPYKDVPAFMSKVAAAEFSVGRAALQFLILTAARSGEVRKARWKDIDLRAAEWRVPPENAKTGRLHIVPLAPAAVEIVQRIHEALAPKPNDLIFPGLKGVMSDATLAKVLRVNGGADYTVHGFRSSFRDWAAETGLADAWAEAALAHTNPNRTESAYRRTTYFEQRKERLMPAWTSFCTGHSSNVVRLASG
jgi:integrase